MPFFASEQVNRHLTEALSLFLPETGSRFHPGNRVLIFRFVCDRMLVSRGQMFAYGKQNRKNLLEPKKEGAAVGTEEYYIVNRSALPEVLLKVVEAKHRLACDASLTVQEVTDEIGLSRSSFYKYRDAILPFHENSRGKTLNVMLQVDDRQGILSAILARIAACKANVLTIQQSIPTGGIASVALGVEILPETASTEELLSGIRGIGGVHYLKILGSE